LRQRGHISHIFSAIFFSVFSAGAFPGSSSDLPVFTRLLMLYLFILLPTADCSVTAISCLHRCLPQLTGIIHARFTGSMPACIP
jgi:hypothetical protein